MKRGLTILITIALLCVFAFSFSACKTKIPDGVELSIMSFNIRQDTTMDIGTKHWNTRKGYLIDHIKENAPAFVGMQEVKENQAEDIKAGLDEYDVIWYSRSTDNSEEGLAIAYRKDTFDLVSEDMFWFSNTPDVQSKGFGATFLRICVHAVLKEKTSQKEISVYCVHLEVIGDEPRNKEIEMVIDRINQNDSGRAVVVLGDFNTTSDSECFEKLSKVLASTQDTALETEYGITYQDFGSKQEPTEDLEHQTIDFIFTSKDFFAKKFEILKEHKEKDGKAIYYSDHYAIKAGVILVQ